VLAPRLGCIDFPPPSVWHSDDGNAIEYRLRFLWTSAIQTRLSGPQRDVDQPAPPAASASMTPRSTFGRARPDLQLSSSRVGERTP
jgi:hypothetical protein